MLFPCFSTCSYFFPMFFPMFFLVFLFCPMFFSMCFAILSYFFPDVFHVFPYPALPQDFHCWALPSAAAGGTSRASWCCWAEAQPCWVSPMPRRCGTRWIRNIYRKSMGKSRGNRWFSQFRKGNSLSSELKHVRFLRLWNCLCCIKCISGSCLIWAAVDIAQRRISKSGPGGLGFAWCCLIMDRPC